MNENMINNISEKEKKLRKKLENKYDYIHAFTEWIAEVVIDKKYNYINEEWKLINWWKE